MKKDVIITIRGLNDFSDDEEKDSIELVTSGRYYEKNGNFYVSYEESALTGLGKTTTTLKVEKDRITVMRFGETQSHMVFEKGRKHLSYYDMGFGGLTVGVSTRSINNELGVHGGKLKIDYAMEINSAVASENAFYMDVREANGSIAN